MATFERLLCMCISHGFVIELSLDFVVCARKVACYEIQVVSQ